MATNLFPQEITNAIVASEAAALPNGTTKLYVDVNRTDSYTETGSAVWPYKTVEESLNVANAAAYAAHPYSIEVAPGVYDNMAPVTIGPYVKLVGAGWLVTTFKAADLSAHFISMEPSSSLSNVCIYGPTTALKACINTGTHGSSSVAIESVTISRGYYGLLCNQDTSRSPVVVQNFTYGYTGPGSEVNTLIRAEGYGEVFIVNSTGAGPTDSIGCCIAAVGENAQVSVVAFYHEVTPSALDTIGMFVDEGAMLRVFSSIFARGHTALKIGSGAVHSSSLRVNGSTIHRALGMPSNYVYDINIENSVATVTFAGFMSRDKINNLFGADIKANFINHETGYEGACALGELVVGDTAAVLPLLSYGKDAYLTGLVSGGEVTRNVSPSRVLQVAAGVGYINDPGLTSPVKITWIPGSVTISAGKTEYVFVDSAGALQHTESQPSYSEHIILAQAVASATDIVLLTRDEIMIGHSLSRIQEFFEDVIGPLSVTGGIITASTTAKKLDVSDGEFVIGISERDIAYTHDVPFYYVSRDGAGGWTYTPSTEIDTVKYDSGSGPVVYPAADHWKKDTWYIVSSAVGAVHYCVYGQEAYNTQLLAEGAPSPAVPDILAHYGMRAATIVTHDSDAVITSIQDIRPMIGSNAPIGTVVAANHNTLSNLGPPNDDHPQYQTAAREAAAHALYSGAHVTGGDSHDHTAGAGAQIDHVYLANKGTTTHANLDIHVGSTSNPHAVSASQAGAIATGAKGVASGVASLDGSTKVVEDPANATATPTANKIVMADASAKVDGWVTADAIAATSSLRKLGTGATDACAGDDSRLSNNRTPTAHASSHATGGDVIPTAVAGASPGLLSADDKTKLNGITAGAAVASVSGTSPIVSSGGTTPALSISAASGAAAGSMSSADFTKLSGVAAGATVNVYGNNYQSAISATRTTYNTNTAFQIKTTLTTPGGLTGTYIVEWVCVLDNSANNQNVEAQLYNATDAAILGGLEVFRATNAGERQHIGGFAEVTLAGVAKTFEIQYRTANTGATVGIAEARIKFYRVN
jgi:hypothetical protein